MGEIRDFDKIRKKRALKLRIRRIIILLIIITLAITVYIFRDKLAPQSVLDWLNEKVALNNSGTGYPIPTPGGEIIGLYSYGSDIALLTDSHFLLYSKTGGEINDIQHGLASPTAIISAGRALMYDRGGKGIRLDTQKRNIFNLKTAQPIITAAISEKGYYAVVTESDKYVCEMTVYDNEQKEIYKWYSSNDEAISIDFNSNSTGIAVMGISVDKGQIKSTLYCFYDFDKDKETFKTEFVGTALLSIKHKSDGNIYVLGNNLSCIVDKKGVISSKADYGKNKLLFYQNSNEKYVAILVGDYTENETSTLKIINKSGEEKASLVLKTKVVAINITDSRVYVLTTGELLAYSLEGELIKKAPLKEEATKLCSNATDVYLLNNSEIIKEKIE